MAPNRTQMYSLLMSFERDMRQILDHYVVSMVGIENTLGEMAENTQLRQSQEGHMDESLLEWLDLRQEYDLLNRHRAYLPEGLGREVRELTDEINVIEPIRHTIMHGRPLRSQHPEQLVSALNKFVQPQWRQLRNALRSMEQDSLWTPEEALPEPINDGIHHNLPLPDYDETGVLGRDNEIAKLLIELKRGRDSVITLTGEGGIGKSALALEIAYRLLDDDECPFQLVLWVSLKTERLTVHGIEEIANSVDSLLGAAKYLGSSLTEVDFMGGVRELAETIGDIPTLLCLDNLETISGDDFVQLYETLPASVSYLVTSRQGIGQIERRFPIGPLQEKDSLLLLNQLVRYRDVATLKTISIETRKEIVRRFRHSPLALRWYILSVEAGRDPLDLIHDQTQLLNFCVLSVYETLSESAKLVLTAMHILSRSVTTDDLVVLAKIPPRQVQEALQELVKGSLVTYALSSSMVTSVEVSETAQAFLNRLVGPDDSFRQQIAENEREFRKFSEKNRADNNARSLFPMVLRLRSDEDRPTASILRQALQVARRGDYELSLDLIGQAKTLSPEYWEVYRVEGFVQSRVNPLVSGARYQRAYELTTTDEHRAVTAHFYASHLARNEHDLDGALTYAREAHRILNWNDTARSLGNILVWAGEFDEGIALLESALQDTEGRERVVTLTAIVDGLRRHSERALNQEKYPLKAWDLCWRAWLVGLDEFNSGMSDTRFIHTALEAAIQGLAVMKVAVKHDVKLPCANVLLGTIADRASKFALDSTMLNMTVFELRSLQQLVQEHVGIASAIESLISASDQEAFAMRHESSEKVVEVHDGDWARGVIVNIASSRGYGFISHPEHPDNVFFHVSSLRDSSQFSKLRIGETIELVAIRDSDGRARAESVRRIEMDDVRRIEMDDEEQTIILNARRVSGPDIFRDLLSVVTSKTDLRYVFAHTDSEDSLNVLVHKDRFPTLESYEKISIGSELKLTVKKNDEGLWSASSVEVVS